MTHTDIPPTSHRPQCAAAYVVAAAIGVAFILAALVAGWALGQVQP